MHIYNKEWCINKTADQDFLDDMNNINFAFLSKFNW